MDFILHALEEPAVVGGQETKYIMDTTHEYSFLTLEQARSGSLIKPIGLPKITLNFFLSPILTSPVTLNGQWKASIWANSTAYKPATFTIQLREVSATGAILWDTGQQSPTVTSSIGEHVDVQVNNYVLQAPLAHTFQTGSTIQTTIEVNAGSSAETRIWFDSPLYPSKVTFPSTDYARPVEIKTYTSDGTLTTMFDIDAPTGKRTISIQTNVTDPYGAYDIAAVQATIIYNSTQRVAGPFTIALDTSGSYSANWTYPITVLPGNYTAVILVTDNNGRYHAKDTVQADPYTESGTHNVQVGPITYYNPVIHIVDDVGDPIPDAQVLVTFPNGSRDELPRSTSLTGTFTLTRVIPADYVLAVF